MRNCLLSAVTAGASALAVLCCATVPAAAQGDLGGLNAAPPPRTRPALPKGGPTPRLPDGKVDFGGTGVWAPIWVQDWADTKYVDKAVDVPFTPAGLSLFQERRKTESKDDPEGYCLPPGVPRYTGTPYPFQLIQLPDRVVILHEGASHMFRVVLMNKEHSKDVNPTWMGESVGHWEGNDTLVVDTIGFNGRTWLDYVGHPASEKLHVVEKFRRPDSLTLEYEAMIDDPAFYTKSWTTSFKVPFKPNWELLEYVCLENNKDLLHLGTTEPK